MLATKILDRLLQKAMKKAYGTDVYLFFLVQQYRTTHQSQSFSFSSIQLLKLERNIFEISMIQK